MQLRGRGDGYLVADRDVAPQFRVVDVPDANVVPALLDRRMVFDLPDRVRGGFRPVIRPDVPGYAEFVRTSDMNMDGAGPGFNLQVDHAADLQLTMKLTLGGESRRAGSKSYSQTQRPLRASRQQVLHKSSS